MEYLAGVHENFAQKLFWKNSEKEEKCSFQCKNFLGNPCALDTAWFNFSFWQCYAVNCLPNIMSVLCIGNLGNQIILV